MSSLRGRCPGTIRRLHQPLTIQAHWTTSGLRTSAARGDLSPDSDIDLLVEFIPGHRVGLQFIAIQDELSILVGREVDLNTPGFLSPHLRARVAAEAIPIYEAA